MSQRTPLIAGNWKMHKTVAESVETAGQLAKLIADARDVEVMIAPAFTALAPVSQVIRGSVLGLGAQNLFWEEQGAFTGEVSAPMLVSAGCRYVIIGHSERRQFFGETDETVNRRIGAALHAGLVPVFCIGESESERDDEKTFSVLDKQIQKGLESFVSEELASLVIAYEPVWAIGTGKAATPQQAQEVHAYVRSRIGELFGDVFAAAIRILYGGSVKPSNVKELMNLPDVDGALVGGASLDAETFSQLVHFNG
jgi:triosephosphate isomerase